ncbi:MAG: helix-turn-helix transcriptional regulator [Clostridia bacterium]|nr:helix-turn-helix transcriptional regulator [Clostridia bacterium]
MNQSGRNISRLRRESNMTQPELADQLGISFQAVSNWERKYTGPFPSARAFRDVRREHR